MDKLEKLLQKRIVILDGATGTNLLGKGMEPGESPSVLNIRNPAAVYRLQRSYVDAGSDAILTNTFSANPLNLKSSEVDSVIRAGITIARKAAKHNIVIGDIGPLGMLIKPYGDGDFLEIRKIYAAICRCFERAGIDILCLETFTSMIEAKTAFLAAREFSDNVIVSFALQDNGRTVMGEIPESMALTFRELGARCVGFNCTRPDVLLGAVNRISGIIDLPILAKPNAGRVEIRGKRTEHTMSNAELASYFDDFVKAGASIIGGCCGTTAEYIKNIARRSMKPVRRKIVRKFFLASPYEILQPGNNDCSIVGERLNPSGRKKVKEQLLAGDYAIYGTDARAQENAGAAALDVNAFLAGLDEKYVLLNCIYEVLKNTRLPLFIDTQNIEAAKTIMAMYPGIGAYNAVPARVKDLKKWLPDIKSHGFKAVISLVGKTIPKDHKERMQNARLVIKTARQLKFSLDNLIFDPLVFSAATDPQQVSETLETVAALHKLGFRTILGISNVSFGLPERSKLNNIFAAAAIRAGAAFLIANPLDPAIVDTVRAGKALFRRAVIDYTRQFKAGLKASAESTAKNIEEHNNKKKNTLLQAIIYGDTALSRELSQNYLQTKKFTPYELIEKHIVRGLQAVGADYEKGRLFIPDLLRSAESAKAALDVIRKIIKRGTKKGKIILATVRGDIHDIGKNVAAMIFEASGYEVLDLGKNVPANRIVAAVKKYRPDAVGLSALLTTTMPEMENVINALSKAGLKARVIIGGPNVTEPYAKKIGAFGAAKNIVEGLKIIERIKSKSD